MVEGIAICPKCHHILRLVYTKRKLRDGTERGHQYFRSSTCATTSDKREFSKVELIEEQVLKLIQKRYGTLAEVKEKKQKVDYVKEIQKLADLKVAYFEKYKQGTLTKQIESLENRRVEEDKKEEEVPTDKLTRELVERYIDFIQCEVGEIKNVIWKDERV